MPSHALSNIEASTGVHVLCYPCSTKGMTTHSFLKSAGACSGLHELPNARAVHMAQLRYFLVFSKRWEKGSRRIRIKIGGKKPLVDGFILISQNRMSAIAETRADLDLHISLLSEHEITRLLQLVSRIAKTSILRKAARRI